MAKKENKRRLVMADEEVPKEIKEPSPMTRKTLYETIFRIDANAMRASAESARSRSRGDEFYKASISNDLDMLNKARSIATDVVTLDNRISTLSGRAHTIAARVGSLDRAALFSLLLVMITLVASVVSAVSIYNLSIALHKTIPEMTGRLQSMEYKLSIIEESNKNNKTRITGLLDEALRMLDKIGVKK